MNIFKILSSYDGSISEPNISAFLAYLIDPSEDHGLGNLLLLELIKSTENFNIVADLDKMKHLLETDYTVEVKGEFSVEIETDLKKKERDIDILVEVYSADDEILYSFCIENKINKKSITDEYQLADEINGLKNKYKSEKTKISLIYLVPEENIKTKKCLEKVDAEIQKKIVLWKGEKDESIVKILRRIIQLESEGKIDPLYDTVKFMIRSFISFIENDFKSDYQVKNERKEKQKYGKPIIQYLREIWATTPINEPIRIAELKKELSANVKKESNKELVKITRDCQIAQVIVNNQNRVNYAVKDPNEDRYNLFYFPDNDKSKPLMKFELNTAPENIIIHFKNNGIRSFTTVKELREKTYQEK